MKIFKFLANLLAFVLVVTGSWLGNLPQVHAQTESTWSDPVNLSASGSSTDPRIVIDARGVMHVIWVDAFDGYKYVRSTDGVTWTSPVTVKFPFSPEFDDRPLLLADETGEIHVLWLGGGGALFYSRALPGNFGEPSTWVGTLKLSDEVAGFDAVTGSRGVLHVGFATSLPTAPGPAGVYYRRLSGTNWSAVVGLYASQYFRGLEPQDANVKLAASTVNDHVFLTWDDRLQKRIFMAESTDGGTRWEESKQILGPDESAGLELPYNINVGAAGGQPLLLWQVGLPGSYCTKYSQRSSEDGSTNEPPVKMMVESTGCPEQSNFLLQRADFSVVLMKMQDDVSLIAWNGANWSTVQTPNALSTFINPGTFDNVFFGCQQAAINDERLFVVGCDQGGAGDIWIRSRQLGTIEDWFPPSSAWTSPTALSEVTQGITAFSSVADEANTIHAYWVQYPLSEATDESPVVQYARWNGEWSEPRAIISGFAGLPSHLSGAVDQEGRLFLSWAEGETGDIFFSWAEAERAYISSEWSQPVRVPTSSPLGSSPDILVDDAGRIAIAYAVPLNEGRGIYVVRTDDLGKTWSQPYNVLDAVAENWDSVDQPRLSLSGDERLHVLFTRISLREDNKVAGLYYSNSADGGVSWSQTQEITEQIVSWSRMVYLNDQTLHLFWQEKSGLGSTIFHQFSRNGGTTWEGLESVSNLPDTAMTASLATDPDGRIHLVQSSRGDGKLIVQAFTWEDFRWTMQTGQEVEIKDASVEYAITVAVSSQGTQHVLFSLIYPSSSVEAGSDVIGYSRSLGEFGAGQTRPPLLMATQPLPTTPSELLDVQPTPTGPSPLANLVVTTPPSRKNLSGLLLVGAVAVLILVFFLPGRKKRIK